MAGMVFIFGNLCIGKSAKGKVKVEKILEIKPDGGFLTADILTMNADGGAQLIHGSGKAYKQLPDGLSLLIKRIKIFIVKVSNGIKKGG